SVIQPKEFLQRSQRLSRQFIPALAFGAAADAFELAEQAEPEGLDFNRVAFARSASGMVGVHPGEMAWAPDESGGGVHANAVWGAVDVIDGDVPECVGDGGAVAVHLGLIEVFACKMGEFLTDDSEPERGIGGIVV